MFTTMSLQALRKLANVSYLGGVKKSAKMQYSFNNGTATYCLYLAPANMSGYEVCPNSASCRDFCLNGAGRNKSHILAKGVEHSSINASRIKKTKLFFENKDLFMTLLIKEIEKERLIAKIKGMEFSVRLNGTSDISPEDFVLNGKNILEIFPDVQFYDYTKIYSRINLTKKYNNYDVTLSYNGYNNIACQRFLEQGGKVAVVFHSHLMPKSFMGFPCEDGNYDDMRYLNTPSSIIYLHYHRTANDYVNGKYVKPNSKFIVMDDDNRCVW
jgi:hypothetical protein